MSRARGARAAFTLLELLISLAIGLLLLAALYVALDLQFRYAETGRDTIQQSILARSLLNRIANDVSASLGPPDRGRFIDAGSPSSTTGQTAPATTGASGTTQPPAQTPPATTTSSAPVFSLAVQGDSERLTLFITRLPTKPRNPDASVPPTSDITRITYWLAGGGESIGLARQEVTLVTSDDASAPPEEVDDETTFVIAEEVRGLSFRYFDGSSWVDSWDGTTAPATPATTDLEGTATPSTTASLPAGPPLAIAVTLGLPKSGGDLKQYRHVIAIPTANGIR